MPILNKTQRIYLANNKNRFHWYHDSNISHIGVITIEDMIETMSMLDKECQTLRHFQNLAKKEQPKTK